MNTALLLFLSLPCFASTSTGMVLFANKFWVGGALNTNWNENTAGVTNWALTSGGLNTAAVAGSGDQAIFDANSNANPAAIISSTVSIQGLDTTGYTGTITHNSAINLNVSAGPFTLSSGMTWTSNASSLVNITNAAGTVTMTLNGQTIGNIVKTGAGTLAFADHVRTNGTNGLLPSAGVITFASDFTGTCIRKSGSTALNLTLGSGTFTITGVCAADGVTAYSLNSTNLTFSGASANIVLADTSATNHSFTGGFTFGSLSITGGGSGIVTVGATSTFGSLTLGAPKSVRFNVFGTPTQTITGTVTCTGTPGNVITIDSSSAGTAVSLSKASGTVSCDYLSLKDSTATGGATWTAGAHSTCLTGVTGWICPSANVGPTSGPYILPGWQPIKH